MPKNVQVPGLGLVQFPDGMSDDAVSAAIRTTLSQQAPPVAGLPAGQSLPGVPGAPVPAGLQGPPAAVTPPSTLQNIGSTVVNLGKGTIKGAGSRITDSLDAVRKIPGVGGLLPDDLDQSTTNEMRGQVQPNGTAQKIGKGIEQVGEFMLPGLGEEAATAKLAALGPKIGAAARIGYGALTSGLVNKTQGGTFTGGALAGGAGGVIGEGVKAAAPLIAESALGVRAIDRSRGRTPGIGILNETKGFDAGNIAKQADQKLNLYTGELNNAAASSSIPVDLSPARQIAKNTQTTAASRNNPDTIKRAGQLYDQLNKESVGNALIPPQVNASRALDLKRGIDDLKGSWNPATANSYVDSQIGQVHNSLNDGLYSSVPAAKELNSKISTLIPVAARAGATDLNASSLQRVLGRFTRPTGALVGGAAGAGYGYHEGGLPGAALGFAGGVVAPELIGSPTVQMMAARTANSALIPPTVKALTGLGAQAIRKKNLYGND